VFIFRARGYPASGKAAEYHAATEEWVKKAHAQGFIVSLARQYFGAEGESCFTVTIKSKDLAEFERALHQIEASAEYRANVSKVLVPFPR